jgi:hypothetical protein
MIAGDVPDIAEAFKALTGEWQRPVPVPHDL